MSLWSGLWPNLSQSPDHKLLLGARLWAQESQHLEESSGPRILYNLFPDGGTISLRLFESLKEPYFSQWAFDYQQVSQNAHYGPYLALGSGVPALLYALIPVPYKFWGRLGFYYYQPSWGFDSTYQIGWSVGETLSGIIMRGLGIDSLQYRYYGLEQHLSLGVWVHYTQDDITWAFAKLSSFLRMGTSTSEEIFFASGLLLSDDDTFFPYDDFFLSLQHTLFFGAKLWSGEKQDGDLLVKLKHYYYFPIMAIADDPVTQHHVLHFSMALPWTFLKEHTQHQLVLWLENQLVYSPEHLVATLKRYPAVYLSRSDFSEDRDMINMLTMSLGPLDPFVTHPFKDQISLDLQYRYFYYPASGEQRFLLVKENLFVEFSLTYSVLLAASFRFRHIHGWVLTFVPLGYRYKENYLFTLYILTGLLLDDKLRPGLDMSVGFKGQMLF